MNNKMFLNKEAGFLAHTKRKRRFAVTLVGVFFMLLVCAGAIGFGQVAYAADEKTVPNRINSNPEFPWYGYDSYSGRLLRYHNLKVNLNGSKEYQAYCFNLKRFEPKKEESSSPNWYKKLDGSTETFKKYAENPRFSGEELRRHILKVLYNGYPNSNEIMKGIDPLNAILVTQNAIWYYSDSAPINDINNFFTSEANDLNIPPQQLTLMREALRKLISSDENLVKQVPSNFKLSIFESSDKSYQNLLSAEYVPDDPPKPGDTSEHNPKTPELDGTPIPEDPKRPDESSEPALPPLMPELDGEEVPEVPSESLEPALPPLMPELDGQEVPEVPSESLEPALPPLMPELDGEEVPEVPSESLEPALPPLMPELDGEEVPEVPNESLEPALPPLMPELDGQEVPEVPSESLEPALPPLMPELDGEEIPEVPSESLEPALPPLMPELDGQEVPEKPSVDLPIEVPRYEFNNKDQSPLAGESGETEYITEVYGNQQNPVDIDKKLPNETGFSGNMVETEDTKEPEVLMGGQSESVEFTKDTQTGMSGQTTPQVETEDTKEPGVLMGGQSESVEFTKDTQTGMSGQTTPQVETEDTKEPGVLMGGQSESVEFTKDTQTGMSGFSETVTIIEDTRPKLVFHFDNNEPKVEENREKPTKNITPILPATGDIGNVLAFLGILILSVLSIFSLLKNKQNNKV
ncbi:TPA: fibronectin-binding protein PrtF1/SfbI [Streptococcus pyogenes]|uniref:fibronectin-binding protein PrtF1/SfbI n=1 Tax=Streptococcus pyogenes TaxID=1314 RepID=UPI000DA3A32C|nr:fibronectin-binding protein PrtF1/SfbI [Streptococcus pyogenes]SQF26223.1 fibronectin-binding protein [Streptococcus pyogenes]VHE82425.1 fibronectin-binding protein [Streptococcus pyogenes]VHF24351.1 fibronectin-binding protein [Streptococcus pyogenes]HEQ3186665.1 fibronectin-binding protein SfbI [Streptococcus pyogenes]HER5500162.1 fibronectin-binding protein SfbI [Streptococcus pyogenes]